MPDWYHLQMPLKRVGWGFWIVTGCVALAPLGAQTPNNQSLSGKYFFRQVSLGMDPSGNLTDARSLLGSITFDGAGHYSFTAQSVLGNAAATAQNGSGAYTVSSAGFVSLDSPIRSGDKVNARYSPIALLGSSTESSANAADFFLAIPAPPTGTSAGSLTGSYWAVSLEFPGGSFTNARNAIWNLNSSGQGRFADFAVQGHAANLSGGIVSQQVTGATYSIGTDGSGTATFGTGSTLLSGSKIIYVSKDGNLILGGSTANGSHDILIAVKAVSGASASTWNGSFWGAGLRRDSTAVTGYSGSMVAGGQGKLLWTRRLKVSAGIGNVDFTGVNAYSVNADASGAAELTLVGLGAAAFVGAAVNAKDPAAYEIYFGAQMPTVNGTGLFINPLGVVSPVSFAPTGNPLSPGAFMRLYGSGFAKTAQTATPPYPLALNGITVLVNNQPAAIYAVTPTTVDFLVPYATQGPTASIVVQTGGASSNTVTAPVSATSPGVLTIQQNGSGPAAVRHADFSAVDSNHPAVGGEIVLVYLTNLGAVNPPVNDGFPGTSAPNRSVVTPGVYFGGKPGNVLFSGLSNYPGLYQINVQVPPVPPGVTSLPLAIQTPNAYHDQVDIPVQP